MTANSARPVRYAAVVIITLVLAAVVLPTADALGALGYFGKKTYLVVLQDNSELMNTGGWLAFVGTIEVQHGQPKDLNLTYNSIGSTIDANATIDGPESFTNFYNESVTLSSDLKNHSDVVPFAHVVPFRNMNVQYDFATFAPLFIAEYANVTGQRTDGVIALDLTALQELLKTTGPLTVGTEVLTWRNVIDRVHYVSAHSVHDGNKPELTNYLTELASKLIATVQTSDPIRQLLLLNSIQTLSQQRHVLVYAPDAIKGYDGAIQKKAGDYVYVVDSNYGGYKADLNLNRTFTYRTDLHDDGTQTSNLTITYLNNNWWDYRVFTTTLVPKGAQVLDARYDTSESIGPRVTQSDKLTAISSKVVVPPYSTTNVTYTYTLPAMVGSGGVVSHYTLYVQKQAGIDHYTLNTDVTLPYGAHLIRESNVGAGMILNGDIQVEVIFR